MTLLPESTMRGLYSTEQMREYGKACRAAALEEAAEYLESRRYFGLAEKIRSMK